MSLLIIDSAERIPGSVSSTDFMVTIPIAVDAEAFELVCARIPNTFYNITALNNTLRFNDGVAKSITVPNGSYTPASLCAAIQTALTAASALTWIVEYSAITFHITISANAAFSLLFANTVASIGPTLGFEAADTAAALSASGTKAVNLLPQRLYIDIPDISTGARSTMDSGTFVIPINASANQIIEYDSGSNFKQKRHVPAGIILRTFRVRLTHQGGATVDLNGSEWSFILRPH